MASAAAVKIAHEIEPDMTGCLASAKVVERCPALDELPVADLPADADPDCPADVDLAADGLADDRAYAVGEAAEQLSDQELRAWRGLLRAHASLAKLLDAELERRHGLPMTSYEVLRHLEDAAKGRMRMCDLAEEARMSRSGLTRLVDRLEREGLLERCSCDHDARGAYACLTRRGRERLRAAKGTHRAVVREHFLSRFSEQELRSLAEVWERIAPCHDSCLSH